MKSPTACPSPRDLAVRIGEIGFSCRRCGACCRPGDGDSGLVFLSHDEVEALVAAGAGSWGEVAAPYPEFVSCGSEASVTFGWCLRHEGGRCRFLGDQGCTRYADRPWICRTYPFALGEGGLTVSDCPGLGAPVPREAAMLMADELLRRARFEAVDEERLRRIFARASIPRGKRCVVDSSGVRVLDG